MPNINNIYISPEGEHDYNKKYKQYTIVAHTIDNVTSAYISIKEVPPFVSITDKKYWKKINCNVDQVGEEVDISGKADKINTPTFVYPSVDGTLENMTDEEIGSLRVGDIIVVEHACTYTAEVVNNSVIFCTNTTTDYVLTAIFVKVSDEWMFSTINSIALTTLAEKVTVSTTHPSSGMQPNILYNLGELTDDITFTLAVATHNTIANIWTWTFETGSTVPNITFPNDLIWNTGSEPVIASNSHYEITVMYNYAMFSKFNLS